MFWTLSKPARGGILVILTLGRCREVAQSTDSWPFAGGVGARRTKVIKGDYLLRAREDGRRNRARSLLPQQSVPSVINGGLALPLSNCCPIPSFRVLQHPSDSSLSSRQNRARFDRQASRPALFQAVRAQSVIPAPSLHQECSGSQSSDGWSAGCTLGRVGGCTTRAWYPACTLPWVHHRYHTVPGSSSRYHTVPGSSNRARFFSLR